MRSYNRIFAFLSVTFLLAFFGKINKHDLYHAFFKSIQDTEIRNSTDLDKRDGIGITFNGEHVQSDASVSTDNFSAGILNESTQVTPDYLVPVANSLEFAFNFISRLEFLTSIPAMAP